MKTMNLRTVMCAILMAVVAACALATPVSAATPRVVDDIVYQDVTPTHPYYQDVMWMQENGYIAPSSHFRPDDAISLAEAITFEERVFNIPSVINNWTDWNGEEYWVRGGQMSIGCTNYATDKDANMVAKTLFSATPKAKNFIWSHEFSSMYGVNTTAVYYDSLKAYGLVNDWYNNETVITRGEFCHIVRLIVEDGALTSDTIFLLDAEYRIYTYGFTKDELTATKREDLLTEIFVAINFIPTEIREAYLNSDFTLHVAERTSWEYVKTHNPGANNAAAFVSNGEIWIGEQWLFNRDILVHEFGHVCHDLAGCPNDILNGLYAEVDRICTLKGSDYARTNSHECFAEAFSMYCAHRSQWDIAVPDLSHYIEDMINLAVEGNYVPFRVG